MDRGDDNSQSRPSQRTLRQSVTIAQESDSIWCSRGCLALARTLGFNRQQAWEISIAVSELVTNIVKHATKGMLYVFEISGERNGLEIVAEDSGPGIADITFALADGYSRGRFASCDNPLRDRRGLGTGLGAVSRMMDEVRIENREAGGTRVAASKWL
jgi:serine/threonine-protein kinase RsbT